MGALSHAMSTTAAAFAVGNVLSSVSLVLVNKLVFSAGFKFPLSLSFCHFCFTVVFSGCCAAPALSLIHI